MVNQGEKAPVFTLPDYERKPRSLPELLKPKGATLLAFFPGAFTSVCTKEMCALRDSLRVQQAKRSSRRNRRQRSLDKQGVRGEEQSKLSSPQRLHPGHCPPVQRVP